MEQCYKFKSAKQKACKPKNLHAPGGNTSTTMSTASLTLSPNDPSSTTNASTEFARNASQDLSPTHVDSPKAYLWNTDTGATSHMTPH